MKQVNPKQFIKASGLSYKNVDDKVIKIKNYLYHLPSGNYMNIDTKKRGRGIRGLVYEIQRNQQ